MPKFMTLDEMLAPMEAEREAATKRELAAEKAVWDALTPAEQAAAIAAKEAKFANLDDYPPEPETVCDDCGEDEYDCTCDAD